MKEDSHIANESGKVVFECREKVGGIERRWNPYLHASVFGHVG